MSDSHSMKFNILKRNRLTSPSSNFKYSNFKDMCCTSAFLDSRYNESVKDLDAEHKEAPSVTSISLLQGHSEHIHPNAFIPVSSSIEKELNSISISEEREATGSADVFESPKSSRKSSSLRRRLLLPKTVEAGTTVESCERQASSSGSIRKKKFSCVLNSEEKLPKTTADSSKDKSYKTLTTSTSKPEGSNPCFPKRRISFSQQRTSTVDESQCKDPLLLESESLSPIQCKDVIVNNTNEFNGSVLMRVGDGVLRTLTYNEANESKFLTSINSPVENLNFGLCDINSPPVKVVNYPDLSTPEDSGYNSLPLDKSGDSLSDHEGSFQELLQKHREDSKILDNKRKTRKLERVRRLSTLQEQGSQSETEDNHGSPTSMHILTEERNFAREDHELVLKEQSNGDLVVSHGDLSRTPALKIVHEICLQRQRSDQKQISENIDGTEIFALDHVLPGLIGKKMGLDKLDILTELKDRNLKHVLAIVLDALTVESLCSIWKVSKNWREIVVQDKRADKRRKLYIKQQKEETEEYLLKAEDAATRLNILNRSALRPVQAQARTPVLQTPPSYTEITPSNTSYSASRQEEYLKVAKTLFTDEALKPCPRCQYPAKYQLVKNRGLCSREACAFEFCILCLHAFHGSKECNSLSAKRKNKKDAPPGSAQSKRNLKRL
ncbi:F-box only protein 43 [Chiroxiphia lanceolata]|uniref:F-box only protein 43 n=1 Tax=Chiroxiphia lanceolata TaxID=296741 RepID=UPI0013CEE25B|nr:F-box only protein 43 [Chiroxiphia lanceolata]XP_032568140.1 F-box only protein 43 [Chiroxiphia lanceolata]XP_032568143.1 F-box only protein 43 [Chiroxiphia lanceolata]XP_032568152.1 F-box only protein 43 [Chiroxiphia lanceolata]XP_032568161.1 F-box only protein 43 [Chiroxiphia lanceolata]XP_032568169.1 F-box only protein 43 [Chiroxiphia lanceolata]XP_032568178.1 F-box only protein 43 [Chiroxiphia lanceolata]XP_032568187.1 F-box only protein 43 [Chiroxiphia lanceolata]XP_032568197.1 F-bo